jgi:hypothetical protein
LIVLRWLIVNVVPLVWPMSVPEPVPVPVVPSSMKMVVRMPPSCENESP